MIDYTSPEYTEEDHIASEPDFYGKWFNVNSKLPNKSDHIKTERVLLWCSKQPNSPYVIGYGIMKDGVNYPYEISQWNNLDSGCNIIFGEVTHWMRLPDPPKST